MADLFTKALPPSRFVDLVHHIGMRCFTPDDLKNFLKPRKSNIKLFFVNILSLRKYKIYKKNLLSLVQTSNLQNYVPPLKQSLLCIVKMEHVLRGRKFFTKSWSLHTSFSKLLWSLELKCTKRFHKIYANSRGRKEIFSAMIPS